MVIGRTLIVFTLCIEFIAMIDYSGYWCRYQYHYTAMTWTSARNVCESTNKSLLIINSMSEMTNISNTVMPHVEKIRPDAVTISSTFWVGLHQEVNPVRLLWDDCNEYTVEPNHWSIPAGSIEGCVLFNTTYNTYSVQNCNVTQPFICEDVTEAVGDCYTAISVDNPPAGIQSDGSTDGANSFEECANICYGDVFCAAFQAKDKGGGLFDCFRNYYDGTQGLQLGRTPAVIYVKNLFVYTDQQPSNIPVISNYYCPETFTTIMPTSSSEQSDDTTVLMYSSGSITTVLSTSLSIASSSVDPILTTTFVVDGTTSSTCYCPCTLALSSSTITSEELQAKIEQIQTELTVNKKETSSYKRKLTSAPDNRVSAQSIGYVGVVILTVVVGLLIFIDIPTLVRDTKNLFKRLGSVCKK